MPIPRWLTPSVVRVLRPRTTTTDGILSVAYDPVAGLGAVRARLDVGFYRPGKDAPLPTAAGRTPDRTATYWVALGVDVRAGDRLECVSGPVTGYWELRADPDVGQGMGRRHHLEGQAIEVTPATTGEML